MTSGPSCLARISSNLMQTFSTRRRLIGWLISAFLFVAVFGSMGLVVYRDWARIVTFNWRLNVGYLVLTSVLYSATLGFMFLVWQSILASTSGFYDVRKSFRIYYLASLARRLPTAIWYVAGRVVMYKQEGVAESAVVASTTIETLAVALAGVMVYLLLLPYYSFGTLQNGLLPIVGSGVLLTMILLWPRYMFALINRLSILLKGDPVMHEVRRRDIARWIVIYVGAWIVGGAGLFCLINTIYWLPLSALQGVIGIATITTLLSILALWLPGGSSLKELALSALLSFYVPFSVGIIVAITYRFWLTVLDIAWAALASSVKSL